MSNNVWIIAEQKEGKLKKVSFELLGIGKKLAEKTGGSLSALLLGQQIDKLTEKLDGYGASKIFVCDSEILANYSNEGYTKAIVDLVKAHNPAILLGGATASGRDLFPRVAARLETGLASDCVGLEINNEGLLVAERPLFAGKVLVDTLIPEARPQMACLRPNVLPVPERGSEKAEIEKVAVELQPQDLKATIKEMVKTAGEKIDLTEASVIVSGGRGMASKENFKILEELAAAFGEGAAVGASRSAVDSDFAPHDTQVGQTGKVVNPNLYIACGISGSIQHLAGMRTSKYIVAINKDPEAPIFQVADYGIVDDLFKIVPLFTEEVKKLKAQD
ncbi:MAG: electron transfer flavoprotein subunit alpha [candidate division Zixibacteria bacterium SM23_73_3]|nr:MAG: electron transfer flavoprotein subunit alpha [candidate division Zixibacteria bacterium SM23_73_3]